MDPVTLIGLVSAVGPFVIAAFKKSFHTHLIQNEDVRGTVHEAITLAIALGASIANAATASCHAAAQTIPLAVSPCHINWPAAIITGLAAGAGASFVRNTDQNILGTAKSIIEIIAEARRPSAERPPAEQPPAERPPAEKPPVERPSTDEKEQ